MSTEIALTCPDCGGATSAPPAAAGQVGTCPHCGGDIPIPRPKARAPRPHKKKIKAPPHQPTPRRQPPQEVIIRDIRIPFTTVFGLVLYVMIASIPAAVLVFLLWIGLVALFGQ